MLIRQTGLVLLSIIMLFSAGNVIAQENQTPVEYKPVLTNPSSGNGTDLTLAITGIISSMVVAGAAFVKDKIDKKSVTKNIKGTDVDMANFVALMSKFFQYAYIYKSYNVAQLLDLPASANVMDKTTLGQALSAQANGWVNFVQEEYNVPRPQMAVASQSIVNAAKEDNNHPTTSEAEHGLIPKEEAKMLKNKEDN